jgi:GAF domain-containing protein
VEPVQTLHVRETVANLVLARALQSLSGSCGMVTFKDVEGRWNRDSFALPGQPDRLSPLQRVFDAILEWSLHLERPVVMPDLHQSAFARHLLEGHSPPPGALVAAPLAQQGAIWGAVAIYRPDPVPDRMDALRELAAVATEPLTALEPGRHEGVT